jgi:oligopeptide/dipeptide ABC transporter ATP-binding protein
MYAGQVVEQAHVDDLFRAPQHPYTEALLIASPHPSLKGQRLPAIPGSPPMAGQFPVGCRFAPRCTHAQPSCRVGEIAIEELGDDRIVRCSRAGDLHLEAMLGVS